MYRPDARFEFYGRRVWHRREDYLHAYWELDGDPISDNYTPEEIDAKSLFHLWARSIRERHDDGKIPIYWFVVGECICESFPGAPLFKVPEFIARQEVEDGFLRYFTTPIEIETGEPIRWTQLYVVNKFWNHKRADKGGFIQSATGWKPHILQPYVELDYLIRLEREYDPLQDYRASKRGAFPLMYRGYQFRSALEVRWAHFLDALQWGWQYEPIDFGGYIPDFYITHPHQFYLEVKPAHKIDELYGHISKIDRYLPANAQLLLVGAHWQLDGYAGLLRSQKGQWQPADWRSLASEDLQSLWAQAHRTTQWRPKVRSAP